MIKKAVLTVVLVLLMTTLSACSGSVPLKKGTMATLPPVQNRYTAPEPGLVREHAETVILHLPSVLNNQLITVSERILIPADQHPAEATMKKLLSFKGNEVANPLFPEAVLQIQNSPHGIEISGDVATINLSSNAFLLSKKELFILRRAITNTLLQWRDIRFVNVLVSGMEPGADSSSVIPAGSLQAIRNEDAQTVWDSITSRANTDSAQALRFSSSCTLYFPSSFGRGILSEARTISFPGQTPRRLASSLLEALSVGPQILLQTIPMPDLNALLTEPIKIEESDTGNIVLSLHFLEEANEAFINAGIPRSIMMASITYTLTTYIPQLEGLKIQIGNEKIEGIVPGGIYARAGEQIIFKENILRRNDFASFLLSDCSLFFADPMGSLRLVHRPIPHQYAFNRRFIMEQLIIGPQVYDSLTGLLPIFPKDIDKNDIMGIDIEGHTVLIDFTDQLLSDAETMTSQGERIMIYSIVNTLCNTRGVQKVRIFINGEQNENAFNSVYLPGEFLRNPEIVI